MQDNRILVTNPKDRGLVLPIGVFDGKVLKRDFALRDMGFPIERSIGRFKKMNESLPNTAIVSKLVSLCTSHIGGEPMEYHPDDSPELEVEALIRIGKMFFADVYYIYVMTRIAELGPEYDTGFACQRCGFTGKMISDLTTMKVSCVQDQSILRREVPLLKGLKFRDGTIKKKVYIQPMLWANMVTNEVKEAGGDSLLMKLHFIRHCVVGVEGVDEAIHLAEPELETLRKIDIERIAYEINAVNIGPSLIAEGNCPNEECKVPFLWPIDWDYDSFFTIASPS